MTQEQILEGNKLIAEFMGFKYNKPKPIKGLAQLRYSWDVPIDSPLYSICHRSDYVYFHTDWNCLMPVVEKIECLRTKAVVRFQTIVEGRYIEFKERPFGHCVTIVSNQHPVIREASENKKEAVWKAVVEFIKWYKNPNTH